MSLANNTSPSFQLNSSAKYIISSVISGSAAGAGGVLVGHPFDSLKVRVQVGEAVPNLSKLNLPMIKQLYRGVVPPLLTVGTLQAINFSIYESFKKIIHYYEHNDSDLSNTSLFSSISSAPNSQASLKNVFVAGCYTGVAMTMITCPLNILKIQMQIASEAPVFTIAREVYKINGFRTFYRGLSCSLITESPGKGVYLWTYEYSKVTLEKLFSNQSNIFANDGYTIHNHKVDTKSRIISAGLAGMISWLVVYPFDVIKSKLQLDVSKTKYSSVGHCIAQTYREGGFKAFFRGLGYTLVRAGPVAGTVLPIYDWTKTYVDKRLY